ncbi:aldehyde dehydrogenase family protein [Novosphingobium taihuense]|uniref:Aldehyde dehydrogenase (NAD+) n=1 Tax=Novosphingobium taihuense TaxID=260085 RepID=A0A7W7A928_9SPHN|nr:aldehyde dehydrogenase family protein [Novosphingobium taihuense]MBB4611970.1 aldehyde dehydrogenase (NAD+) [Novosphingobium taihuense]TWH88677.1 aldehyde dehydrogenase (NAD+) [Novosphingobium taihuense]
MPLFDPDTIRPALAANFIGGKAVVGSGHSFMVTRPSDGGLLGELRAADTQQLADTVENAALAQKASGWGTMEPRGRMRLLRRWADLIEADAATLAPLEAAGSSRTLPEILAWDLPYTAECIRFFAEFADKHGGEIGATTPDKLGFTLTQPYGVVGAIAPWNLPLVMAAWKLGPALAAGNAVVLKPSELTPFSVVRLAELAVAAGIPAGVFNVVQGGGADIGDALVRHEAVGKVSFTGSTRTGRAIMAACAQTGPKPSTLELGGKSPQLVFADADIPKASALVARAITLNSGQVCVAGSRLLVQDKVRDEVVERLTTAFESHRIGSTWDEGTTMGPIISEGQLAQIDGIVQRARANGAEAVTGGARATSPQAGSYYQPTLLANAAADSEAVQGEIFGPVLTVQSFADEEEAFALANGTRYGLAAGVHTNDLSRAMRAIRTLDAGTVWVNRYGRSDDFILPTGGFRQSGVGKDLGREAYLASCKVKTALIQI